MDSTYVVPTTSNVLLTYPIASAPPRRASSSQVTLITYEFCGGQVVAIINEPEESMQVGEEESDDDDGDYVDEVTVSESEMLAGRTPEEAAAGRRPRSN